MQETSNRHILLTVNVSCAIGNTPLIKISEKIYAKLESVNPSGSIKDRMACYILDKAEKEGKIKRGQTIVEATSGNTGISFSMLAALRGYKMIVVMPSNMSEERKKMIRDFGAQIVEVGKGDFRGACKMRDKLIKKLRAFNPNQFANKYNRQCHCRTTAVEILRQIKAAVNGCGKISGFVAGVGTGGTLMGVRDGLIKRFPHIKIAAVEPKESAVMSGGKARQHNIQGIGDGFIPELIDMNCIDEVITVSEKEAIARMKRLSKELGLFVGISSGANVYAAEKFIKKHNPAGVVITILPDSQDRYLSLI